ncbi:EAL domain-containing protein [Kordiimonas pumila]|uniref:EAL domain-containing protein n=1 Tax=Kordiimonas pumila TaxID=2161677 RepID=A0ABV7D8S6_9PROT|nr:EAL domain-containing protein [Kordiimonas pumila]
MKKVPDRFLGYAYCVGDVLMELGPDFVIQNADGAVKSTFGDGFLKPAGTNFLDLLTERGRGVVESAAKTLTGANRLGPFTVSVGLPGSVKEQFAIFMAKLPTTVDHYYIVMSKPYRVGLKSDSDITTPANKQEKKQDFYERLEGLFEANPEAEENMQVTVLETGSGEALNLSQQRDLEEYLKSYSIGGNHAAMLGDDKFAFVHEKTSKDGKFIDYANEIKNATGIAIKAATIDAADANLSERDSIRAMVFSLQQFADDKEGFDVSQIQENCTTLIGETTERVKAFRKVLADGAFSLVYQPIVDLKKKTTHHFEALARFELPDVIKSQWEMIRFAEDVGLISDFDKAVLNRTIQKLRELMRKGVAPGIAVNVSGRSLSDSEFILDLVSTLKGNKDLKKYLAIEITESSKIHDLDMLSDALNEIRAEGFRVYLDDFGAGAAGFQYLKKLKVDALKIDGDYVRNALESREDRAFLRSMVTLCKDLGIVTVGEWVETKQHAELLTAIGVDYGQGYFFGKPSNAFISDKEET